MKLFKRLIWDSTPASGLERIAALEALLRSQCQKTEAAAAALERMKEESEVMGSLLQSERYRIETYGYVLTRMQDEIEDLNSRCSALERGSE